MIRRILGVRALGTPVRPLSALATILIAVATPALPARAAAADERPRIAFIALHGGVYEPLKSLASELGMEADYINDEAIADGTADLSPYRVVLIQHVRVDDKTRYRDLFLAARSANPKVRIFSTGEASELAAFLERDGHAKLLEFDPEMKYSPSSKEHLRRFLIYLSVTYLGGQGPIPPMPEPESRGLFHPGREGRFDSVDQFLEWSAGEGRRPEGRPRVAITAHQTHLEFQQSAVVAALIREFESRGVIAAAFVDSKAQGYEELMRAFRPDVVVHTCHSQETEEFRKELDAPQMHSVYFRQQSIEDWLTGTQGISGGESALHVIGPERLGEIEPQVTAGTVRGGGGEEGFTPIPERVAHLADRAESWIRLRRAKDADKRVAIVYYDRELGRSELMRGSPTGMFMNGPRSIVRVLGRMKGEGYSLSAVPASEDELLAWMQDHGRQIGLWDPAELDRLARSGQAVLVPESTYKTWFTTHVPESVRHQVTEHWGEAPGNLMVWNNGRERFVVIPRIDLGNVILLPQPLRGEAHDPTLLHNGIVAPPHNYIATYLWLEHEFGADALVHFGTHGNEFALPAKPVGLSERDWPDILLGRMPNINPWIVENTAEALYVKRRAYGVLIGHLPPPVVGAGLSDDMLNLEGLINKWRMLEQSGLREAFRRQIAADVARLNLAAEAGLDAAAVESIGDEQIDQLADYLHEIANEATPVSLHILGDPPRDDLVVPYLVTILKRRFLDGLAGVVAIPEASRATPNAQATYLRPLAEQAVELVVRRGLTPAEAVASIGGRAEGELPEEVARGFALAVDLAERFGQTGQEIDNFLRALDGRFIPAGPVNSPIRNPAVVPTGRNLSTLNPEEIPTRPSWEVGKRLVDQLIQRSLETRGRYPTRIGFTLGSMATYRDFGVMESQILYLLGVEPVWDEKDLVNDVRLIPAEELKRPRIDVFISNYTGGRYPANLPGRLELIDRAIRLVAALDEPENAVHGNTVAIQGELERNGLPAERAASLAQARIFGPHLDEEGPRTSGVFQRIQQTGSWEDREELVDQYIRGVQYAYTEGHWGELAPEAFRAAIQGTETIVRSWSDSLRGPLSNKYYWLRGGMLSMAVQRMTGREPEFLLSDVRDFDAAEMIRAEDAVLREARARLFNRKWIEGMMKEGYAGADQVAVMVSNTMGWAVTRPESIPAHVWAEIDQVYVQDRLNLSIRSWFEAENPHALQEVLATMLEATRKGYWEPGEATIERLAETYARSVVAHGDSVGLRTGGNLAFQGLVERTLRSQGTTELAQLASSYHGRMQGVAAPGRGPAPTSLAAAPAPAPAPAPAAQPAEPAPGQPAPGPAGPQAAASPPPGSSPSDSAPTASQPAATEARAEAKAAPPPQQPAAAESIQGQRLEPAPPAPASDPADDGPEPSRNLTTKLLAASALILILGGFFGRRRMA